MATDELMMMAIMLERQIEADGIQRRQEAERLLREERRRAEGGPRRSWYPSLKISRRPPAPAPTP